MNNQGWNQRAAVDLSDMILGIFSDSKRPRYLKAVYCIFTFKRYGVGFIARCTTMLCRLGTIGAGIGVLAVCLVLASLSWQFLLLGFTLASIAWTVRSCCLQLRQLKGSAKESVPPVVLQSWRRRTLDNLVGLTPQTFNDNVQNM